MRWGISKGLDGIITDDPKRFLEICDEWEQGKRAINISWKQWMMIAWINLMVVIFGAIFWWKYSSIGRERTTQKRVVALPSKKEEGQR